MTPDFCLRIGDLLPVLTLQAVYSDNAPVNLTGATVVLTMTQEGSTAPTVSAQPCVVTDPLNGIFYYAWASPQTNTPGDYTVYAKATIAGQPLSSPNWGFLRVSIADVHQ